MSVVLASIFLLRYPEFSDQDASLIQMILDESSIDLIQTDWDASYYPRAIMLLTAHVITMKNLQLLNLTGALAEVGQNKMPTFSDFGTYLKLTSYGLELLRLRSLSLIPDASISTIVV